MTKDQEISRINNLLTLSRSFISLETGTILASSRISSQLGSLGLLKNDKYDFIWEFYKAIPIDYPTKDFRKHCSIELLLKYENNLVEFELSNREQLLITAINILNDFKSFETERSYKRKRILWKIKNNKVKSLSPNLTQKSVANREMLSQKLFVFTSDLVTLKVGFVTGLRRIVNLINRAENISTEIFSNFIDINAQLEKDIIVGSLRVHLSKEEILRFEKVLSEFERKYRVSILIECKKYLEENSHYSKKLYPFF